MAPPKSRVPTSGTSDLPRISATLSKQNDQHLRALLDEHASAGLSFTSVLNDELAFARTYGLPAPYLAAVALEAKRQALSVREYVQTILMKIAFDLPKAPSTPGPMQTQSTNAAATKANTQKRTSDES